MRMTMKNKVICCFLAIMIAMAGSPLYVCTVNACSGPSCILERYAYLQAKSNAEQKMEELLQAAAELAAAVARLTQCINALNTALKNLKTALEAYLIVAMTLNPAAIATALLWYHHHQSNVQAAEDAVERALEDVATANRNHREKEEAYEEALIALQEAAQEYQDCLRSL